MPNAGPARERAGPARSITVLVQGGSVKTQRGTNVTASVATTAKVTRNDAKVTLDKIVAGDHVSVTGTAAGTVLTADGVHAEGPTAAPAPVESATP